MPKQIETAQLICWVRTPSDKARDRDSASKVASALVPRKFAKIVAQDIDSSGNSGAYQYLGGFGLKDGESLAAGHGVLVVYASGASRTYRYEW